MTEVKDIQLHSWSIHPDPYNPDRGKLHYAATVTYTDGFTNRYSYITPINNRVFKQIKIEMDKLQEVDHSQHDYDEMRLPHHYTHLYKKDDNEEPF